MYVYVFCDVLYMYVGLCVSECYNERVGMGEREKERQTERERERGKKKKKERERMLRV